MVHYIILVISSVAVLALLGRTIWALSRFKYRPSTNSFNELPSVSICIAARNETHSLVECLEHVLASDYQKLEILVLDDSSDDDTSLIIKSFAGAGVRFIAGKPLPEGWLGKNHAYQTLIDEASGDYVLFLDVDTVLKPNTVSQLMSQLLANKRAMLSVLPRREDGTRISAMFSTMRYCWELLLATRNSPPAASALWVVNRQRLQDSNVGLANYKMSVRPERHLARQLQRTKDYFYLIGTATLGVSFAKRMSSQHETATRLYYPMSGRSYVMLIVTVSFLLILLAPLAILMSSPMTEPVARSWSLLLIVVETITLGLYWQRTYASPAWQIRSIVWPLLIVQELALLIASFGAYKFDTVTWKGRAVNAQPSNKSHLSINE